jgi:LysR family nitrogen assimilation transcriptional regulator
MDLKQLEYFVRVAELGSFTRAAIELDVAQPALSRQVRLLEVELRQTLLVRNGRGAVPTEAGKLLLDHGRGILHQVERARDDLGRLRGGWPARGRRPAEQRGAGADRAADPRLPRSDAGRALSISEGLSSGLQPGPDQRPARHRRALQRAALARTRRHAAAGRRPAAGARAPPGLHEDPPPGPIDLREVARLPLVIPTRPNAIRMHVESAMADVGAGPTWCWRSTA